MRKVTIAMKVDALTDEQVREIAAQTGRQYLDVVKDLQRMKEKSLYYQSDVAREAAKRYRAKAKIREQMLKALL